MRLKDIIENIFFQHRKKVTYSLIRVFVLAKISLYNGDVGPNKLVKVLSALYKQNLVYQNPVKKQNDLNDIGPTKAVKVLPY